MKNNKLLVLILLLIVGFAAVSTTLLINGMTNVAENTSEFDVYFSNAVENGIEKRELIKEKTHIAFTVDMKSVGEKYELVYDVTNGSKNYDAEVTLNVPTGNEYIRVTNDFDTKALEARTTRVGKLILEVIKATTTEKTFDFEITIEANAVERTELLEDEIKYESITVDLKNAVYKGDTDALTYNEEDGSIILSSGEGWVDKGVYIDNISLGDYKNIEITYSFKNGYDWYFQSLNLNDNSMKYIVKSNTFHENFEKRTGVYKLEEENSESRLRFYVSSLNAKLTIYSIKLYS